jgi:type IV pilus assembly protein PilB
MSKLGEILIAQGVIDKEKLTAALSDQRAFGGKLGRTLVDLGYLNEDQLVAGLAKQLELDTVDLDSVDIEMDALSCLPVDACERYGVFPVKLDAASRVLWVATAEPDRQTLQEVAGIARHTLEPMLASMSSIDRAIRRYYFGERFGPKQRLGEPLTSIPGDVPQRAKREAAPASPPPVVPLFGGAGFAGDGRSADARSIDDEVPEAVVEPDPQRFIGSVAPGENQDALQELKTILIRLEKNVNAQSRAFRALVDLLQDKGIVRRGELGARASKKP